jgi:uncharacterized protein (TIGR02466 family)
MVTPNVALRWITRKLKEKIVNISMLPSVIKNEAVKQTVHIEPFFPTPLGFLQMDKALSKKILEFMKSKEIQIERNNRLNGISSSQYILENDELSDIKKVLTDSVNEYFKEIVTPDQDMKLYITNSWINVTKNGESHHPHKHPNSIVSAILYIDTCEGDTISFKNPNAEIFGNLNFGYTHTTKLTIPEWNVPVTTNTLIVFPSTLTHRVQLRPNICTGTRISLSFNTWFKGTIGCGKANANELRL